MTRLALALILLATPARAEEPDACAHVGAEVHCTAEGYALLVAGRVRLQKERDDLAAGNAHMADELQLQLAVRRALEAEKALAEEQRDARPTWGTVGVGAGLGALAVLLGVWAAR